MTTAAIIAEFNPFHNGHAYLISEARRLGADCVLVMMSGNFVQRGEPAVFDQHLRAQAALSAGADLVLALPARHASVSAEHYAMWNIRALKDFGIIDFLLFGSECGELSQLSSCAEILSEEPGDFRERLKDGLRSGLSFPKARAGALPEYAELLREPNNILAVEYLKAIRRQGAKFEARTVRRVGDGYYDPDGGGRYSSAGAIREVLYAAGRDRRVKTESLQDDLPECSGCIFQTGDGLTDRAAESGENTRSVYETMHRCMPGPAAELAERAFSSGELSRLSDYDTVFAAKLFETDRAEDYLQYEDVTEELAERILARRNAFSGCGDFAKLLASKSLTEAHARRAVLHMTLGIRKDVSYREASAVHLLAADGVGKKLIPELRRQRETAVLIRPKGDLAGMTEEQRLLMEEEFRISNLYGAVRKSVCAVPFRNTYERGVFYAEDQK